MTLVLALASRDGVVLASDGQVTSDAAGQPTRQPARKLFDVGGRVAWGAAGSLGLQQTLRGELGQLNGQARGPGQLRRRLASLVIPVQQEAMHGFVSHHGADPPDLACLFCWCEPDGPRILSIPRTGSDHQFHDRYAAIGTGDIFAALTMRSIAHLVPAGLGLEEAKMVAYRAVADAIDVAAVYLGPPIQMYVVTPAGGAQRIARDEIEQSIADAVDVWRGRQHEILSPIAEASPSAEARYSK
jgi:20S proteasome alpha/beta subunit